MHIGKYIFIIFLSLYIMRSFRGVGFGNGGQGRTKILKFDIFLSIFAKKDVFLVSSGENVILPLLAAHAKIFLAHPWKIHYWPLPGKNPSGAQV